MLNTNKSCKVIFAVCLFGIIGTMAMVGCRATPIGAGINVVGLAVDDGDVKKQRDKFMGKHVGDMSAEFGQPMLVYADMNADRELWVYRDKSDITKKARYVAEVKNNKVTAITKTRPYEDYAIAIPMKNDLEKKCLGKTASFCQKELDKGRPVAVMQNNFNGHISEVYDIRVTSVQNPHYAIFTYDNQGKCRKIQLVESRASTKKGTI